MIVVNNDTTKSTTLGVASTVGNGNVTPETTELLGERIDLNSGSVSFHQIDISLPGNFPIAVQVKRVFRGDSNSFLNKLDFANWQLDIPSIHTQLMFDGGKMSGSWGKGQECSDQLDPGPMFPWGNLVESYQYWNGDFLNVPGKINDKLLRAGGIEITPGEKVWRKTKSN